MGAPDPAGARVSGAAPAPQAPRLAPLPPAEWGEEARALLTADLGADGPDMSRFALFTTVARHERLLRPWLLLGRRLTLRAALPFADRELLVLRTAWNCRSAYEWGQHARIAVDGGLERAVVDRVPQGPAAAGWDARQRLLLRAADELHREARLSEETWSGLAGALDERQLVELPMLVGYYHLVAYTLGALAIAPEPGGEPLPPGADGTADAWPLPIAETPFR